MKFDFIVIGSGLAGLTSSLVLKEHGSVLLISKSQLDNCATNLAQGGIAAVVTEGDSFEAHVKDTLIAGCFHNDKKAVSLVVQNAPSAIVWLEKNGVRFERKNSQFAPTREAAHSHHRVLHASDFTGREIERALISKVRQSKNIEIWENCFVVDLLVKGKTCFGVRVIKDRQVIYISSRVTILATGGLGQIYQWTTNPKVSSGDGIAMAYRAGVEIADMEFIQFHPTALKDGESPLFLLSEALRGEGGYLIKVKSQKSKVKSNQKGERFMKKIDPRAELAPRDIVARAIFNEQQKGFQIYLDIRHKGEKFLKMRFPNIYKELKKRGLDLAKDLIPVTPAAHYSCGGIKTDLYGRTNIKSLFAFGEVACTGVHGANRLASNSLLEAVVFPLRLKECVSNPFTVRGVEVEAFPPRRCLDRIPHLEGVAKRLLPGEYFSKIRQQLQRLMWEKVGIVRTKKGLQETFNRIEELEREVENIGGIDREISELENMLLTARLITQAALKRQINLGAHFIM